MGARDDDRRPGARGERAQRDRGRADRRGDRPRARRASVGSGFAERTDVIVTTDHGELQGDFGLLFKGPYHTDGLLRLPLIWRPAPCAAAAPSVVTPTGRARRPRADVPRDRRRRGPRRGWRRPRFPPTTPTRQRAASTPRSPSGTRRSSASTCTCARSSPTAGCSRGATPGPLHDGTEGELYDLADDPLQRVNRFDDPACAGASRRELLERSSRTTRARCPARARTGPLVAPV